VRSVNTALGYIVSRPIKSLLCCQKSEWLQIIIINLNNKPRDEMNQLPPPITQYTQYTDKQTENEYRPTYLLALVDDTSLFVDGFGFKKPDPLTSINAELQSRNQNVDCALCGRGLSGRRW